MSGWAVTGLGFPKVDSPELPRSQTEAHSNARYDCGVGFPPARGRRVEITLNCLMVTIAPLCWVSLPELDWELGQHSARGSCACTHVICLNSATASLLNLMGMTYCLSDTRAQMYVSCSSDPNVKN